jgi:hypothetical protein
MEMSSLKIRLASDEYHYYFLDGIIELMKNLKYDETIKHVSNKCMFTFYKLISKKIEDGLIYN